jgi:mono/diheme cytochrome c family protein
LNSSLSFKSLVSGCKFRAAPIGQRRPSEIVKAKTENQKLETLLALVFAGALLLVPGCRQQMADQPRYDPLEPSNFFTDGQSARPPVEHTVARGQVRDDEHLYEGTTGGAPASDFPFPVTAEVLQRGRERYNIYCSPCHSRAGYGDGMVARRGFGPPASLHTDILRKQPPGHFFRVITQGFGAMPSYSQQIAAQDRWAIVAYVRALQLSQFASISDLPAEAREKLSGESR